MELSFDIYFLCAWGPVQEGKHWKLAVTSLSKTKAISRRLYHCPTKPLFIFQESFSSPLL